MTGKAILLLIAVQCSLNVLAQEIGQTYKWEASISFAYEQHDMRIWRPPGWTGLHEKEYGEWGTYWYGASLHRILLGNRLHQLKAGLGYASEMKTLRQSYDARKLLNVSVYNDAIHYTNRYKIKHLQIPINYSFRLLGGLCFSGNITSDFSFFKRAAYRSDAGNYWKGLSKFRFDFYSVSFYPGLQYSTHRFSFRFDYRVLQWKKTDQVIPADRYSEKVFETHNPAHLRLSVSYAFGKKELAVRE
jgi:hypothetical protein